jgi:hypothetical protein
MNSGSTRKEGWDKGLHFMTWWWLTCDCVEVQLHHLFSLGPSSHSLNCSLFHVGVVCIIFVSSNSYISSWLHPPMYFLPPTHEQKQSSCPGYVQPRQQLGVWIIRNWTWQLRRGPSIESRRHCRVQHLCMSQYDQMEVKASRQQCQIPQSWHCNLRQKSYLWAGVFVITWISGYLYLVHLLRFLRHLKMGWHQHLLCEWFLLLILMSVFLWHWGPIRGLKIVQHWFLWPPPPFMQAPPQSIPLGRHLQRPVNRNFLWYLIQFCTISDQTNPNPNPNPNTKKFQLCFVWPVLRWTFNQLVAEFIRKTWIFLTILDLLTALNQSFHLLISSLLAN